MDTLSSRPRIAYVSVYNPHDRRAWSGISYYMAAALQRYCGDVSVIEPPRFDTGQRIFAKAVYCYRYRRSVSRQLNTQRFDVVFAPPSAPALALLKSIDIPVVFLSDNTWRVYHAYYHHPYSGRWLWRARDLLERLALKKASLLLYPSEWAAQSAHLDYGVAQSKIRVLPFGANLDEVPSKDQVLKKERSDVCRLLFLGLNWTRKGGPIAIETLMRLQELGVDAELTVCGCTPPADYLPNRVTVIPHLDKRCESDRRRLDEILSVADFLLLPTRAECFGIVFCEASAYGLPVITTDTGGVSGAVIEGVNGHRLPLEATSADYARLIYDLYSDGVAYSALVRGSREMYDRRLNWAAWGSSVHEMIMEVL
jgi:glycosyltransferase involved in cell wall biosynthesis